MSYFRRGYNWEQVHYLPAPVGGWNPDANSWELPQNQAPVLDNFLIQPGKIVARAGFYQEFDLTAHAPLNLCGMAPTNGDSVLVLGQRVASLTANTDPWRAPIAKPNAGQLGTASTTVLSLTPGASGATPSSAVVALNQVPGFQWVNFDGAIYAISYDAASTVSDVNSTYSTKKTNLLIMVNSAAPTVPTGGIFGATDLKGHLGRIWLLGGVDVPGGGTTHSCTSIFFSNPIASGGGMVNADWQDPATGLTNTIVMDKNSDDPGIALATTRNALIVLRSKSIWAVLGTTTANFTVRRVSNATGCLDPRAVVDSDHGVFFMSRQGLMLTDGVTIRNVSGSVMRTLQMAIGRYLQSYTSKLDIPSVTCTLTSSGAVFVSIGVAYVSNSNNGSLTPLWSGLYDPSTNAWTRVTSQLWSGDVLSAIGNPNLYPGLLLQHNGGIVAAGDKYVTTIEQDGVAYGQALSYPRGVATQNARQLYDERSDLQYRSIPLHWRTRLVPIVGASTLARKFGQAKRYFLDYTFAVDGQYQPTTGWAVSPVDVNATSLGSSMSASKGSLISNGSSVNGVPSAADIARANQDFVSEVSDFSFDLTFSDVGRATSSLVPAEAVAELYGVGVEFQPTRDLR